MSVETPGWVNESGSYSSEQTRRAVFAAYARTGANSPGIIAGGLISGTDLQLSAPGSGLSVNVSTGECIIGGTEGVRQGGYYCLNESSANLTISAANPSNPRIDTVCATVSDSGYTEPSGGSGNQWALQVVTGTPTSGATLTNLNGAASLPLSSLLLGYVLVPASASSITSGDILNVATIVLSSLTGTWVPLVRATGVNSPGAVTGAYVASARLEAGGVVRLKGVLYNASGSLGGTNATIATLPSASMYPSGPIYYLGGGASPGSGAFGSLDVTTAGALTVTGMSTGYGYWLDGISFTTS